MEQHNLHLKYDCKESQPYIWDILVIIYKPETLIKNVLIVNDEILFHSTFSGKLLKSHSLIQNIEKGCKENYHIIIWKWLAASHYLRPICPNPMSLVWQISSSLCPFVRGPSSHSETAGNRGIGSEERQSNMRCAGSCYTAIIPETHHQKWVIFFLGS